MPDPVRSWRVHLDRGVALGLALTAGVVLAALVGPVGAVLGALLVFVLAVLFFRFVRRRPWLRRLTLLLLVAYLAFAAVQGIARASFRSPGEVRREGETRAVDPGPFAVGIATRPFALPERATLAGWGLAPRRRALPAYLGLGPVGRASLRWMGPVFARPEEEGDAVGARAVVVKPAAGAPLALVRLDLVLVDAALVFRIQEEVRALGYVPATTLVQATHTHSGPGGTMHAPLAEALGTDHFDARIRDAVVGAAVDAIREADESAKPARLAVLEAEDRSGTGLPFLAKIRGRHADRDPDADRQRIDARVLALRFSDRASGAPIAVVVHYAVQPVMLRPRHLLFGRDLPGAIEDALEARLPGGPPVLFLNGHCGDVTPRRGRLSGPDGARQLAAAFADLVLPALSEDATEHERIAVHACRCARDLGTPYTFVALGPREAFGEHVLAGPFGDDPPQGFAAALCLPLNLGIWSLGLSGARVGFTFDGAVGAVLNLEEAVEGGPSAETHAGAVLLESDDGIVAAVLWHPAVATQALLRRWRETARRRDVPTPFVLGLTGGSMGYLVTEEEYEAGRYEALSSLYGPRGSERIEALLIEALGAARAGATAPRPRPPAGGFRGGNNPAPPPPR